MAEPCPRRVEELFDQAIDLDPARLTTFLDEQCAGDAGLRAAVEELLQLDRRAEAADTLLRSPVAESRRKAPAPPAPPLPTIGRYRLVRVLGEGGMGTVYEAEQDNPRRTVALKVIRPGLVSPELLKRFAREAQILGLLHHPGIAAIYEAAVAQDGRPFFAMELVRGVPLDTYARHHGLDGAARLELLARVCDAVQHAHEHGVVHRDLKPSNILVDETGQPRVLDFGVARGLADELRATTAHTQPGQVLGTPSYMSPEQVAADPNLDRRSDVYTLGVILFELLTGRLPHAAEHLPVMEAMQRILEGEPARLGALDRRLRGDVETIVGKALEKDPARRYPSAAELAADIRRHLRHEPIRARPPSALYRLGKFAQRHKALVATTAAFLGLLLGAGAVTAWQAVRLAQAERDQALRQARTERDQARRSQDVQDALAQAKMLREQARKEAGDQRQWTKAREMAKRAETLVEGGPVAPGLAKQVDVLRRELDEEEKDRRLVARLEKVQLLQVDVDVAKDQFTEARALPGFREAFADYGLRAGSTEPAEAADLLRRRPAEVRGPAVAALNSWLFLALRIKAPEAGWLERVLAAADPDDWRQRLRDARVAKDLRAVEGLADEVEVAAQPPRALAEVAGNLQNNGRPEAAVRLLRRAWDAYPGDFWINTHLGLALARSQPRDFWVNHPLGMAPAASRPPQHDEAIRFLSVAVGRRPESAGAWSNLADTYLGAGRIDEAIAACRKAIGLRHDYAAAHATLGNALVGKGRLDEAIAAFRESISIRRRFAPAHYNLGTILLRQGDYPAAAACFLEAIQIDSEYAEAHCNLGNARLRQGDLHGALEAVRIGHKLGARRKDWRYPQSAQWVKDYERYLQLQDRLPAILKGEDRPASAAERIDLAELCRYKRLYVNSVRFYAEAVKADTKLAASLGFDHHYGAVRSAALAGCGEGGDVAGAPDSVRASLRGHALKWLRVNLADRDRRLEGGTPQDRAEVQSVLHIWRNDPALAGVRDPGPLAALPPAERAAWEKLWADVAATRARARGGK
jgi:tetratricopeptide (TPR) repeat protein/predicted Ser/Thr protein kinase